MTAQRLALVVACIALVGALAGTGAATVSQLAKGSVGTAQLKGGAVTSSKVQNGSLAAADFKAGQVRAGPVGRVGAAGPAGERGLLGSSTAYHVQFSYRTQGGTALGSDFTTLHTLDLPAGGYAAFATTTVWNNNPVTDSVICEIAPSTGDVERYAHSATSGQREELSGTAAFTLPASGSVTLRCRGVNTGDPAVNRMTRHASSLTAIRVSEVVQQ